MKKIFKNLNNIISDLFLSVFFKIAFFATIITGLFVMGCFFYYNTAVKASYEVVSEGAALAEGDLSDEVYDDIASRFTNSNGETYKDYKMTEGIGISFYGDGGITDESSGGYTMPAIVALNFLDRYIYIMGNEGELPEDIASRQGGVALYARPFTIPKDCEPVEISLYNEYCSSYIPNLENNGGLNPCRINGIEGIISVEEDGKAYFTRAEEGARTVISEDTALTTRAMENRRGDIVVVFIQELPKDYSPKQYVDILLKMRSFQRLPTNEKCFYVVGPVLNTDAEEAAELEALLEEAFGTYFINAREYICKEAADRYKVTIRDEEYLKEMDEGRICRAFLTRDGHLNLYGLYAVSDLLTERLNENNKELLKIELEHRDE